MTIQKDYSPLLSDTSKQYIKAGYEPANRKIIVAANRLGTTGILLVGARHWDKVMDRQFEAIEKSTNIEKLDIEQGFIDQFGQFLNRKEAYEIAHRNKQELVGEDWGELFSENLY